MKIQFGKGVTLINNDDISNIFSENLGGRLVGTTRLQAHQGKGTWNTYQIDKNKLSKFYFS